jgi:hypothetical protein
VIPENTLGGKISLKIFRRDAPFVGGESLIAFTGQPDNAYNIK